MFRPFLTRLSAMLFNLGHFAQLELVFWKNGVSKRSETLHTSYWSRSESNGSLNLEKLFPVPSCREKKRQWSPLKITVSHNIYNFYIFFKQEVQPNSPADLAGLRSNTDYIIGADSVLHEV
jgi:hypothetical protein